MSALPKKIALELILKEYHETLKLAENERGSGSTYYLGRNSGLRAALCFLLSNKEFEKLLKWESKAEERVQ